MDTDHNNDGYMNFREFIQFVYEIYRDDPDDLKAKQLNCSACVEIEYYNPKYQ